MPIKLKILIPMVFFTIVSGVTILISNIIQFSDYIDSSVTDSIHEAAAVSAGEIETLKSRVSVASLYMAQDPKIIHAMESGDRDALVSRSKELQAITGVGFCTIADASGIAIARPHDPQSYGDDVTGISSVRSALSGQSLTVIEEGVSVRMSVCSGAPVYNAQGQLLGVVCVGFRLDTNAFVDAMKELTGCEVTIFLQDERISTTVVKEDGTRAVGTKAAADISEMVLSGNAYTGQAKILEHDAYTQYSPITGDDGQIIGMLFTGQYLDEAANITWGFIKTGSMILVLLLAIAVLIIFYISKRIVAPISVMVNAANALAVGDIDVDVRVDTKDEMRKLADAFNGMIENTRKQAGIIETVAKGDLSITIEARSDKDIVNNALIRMLNQNNEALSQIASSAVQVSAGSQQIADGAQALAQGATKQASSIEEFSASLNELQKKTQKNAENSANAQTLARQSGDMVGESIQYMREMLEAMKTIDESSQSITKVIKSIDDIAFQTNILALNAAVEAARAGQHGKGFAVVAEEVRNLASKSAQAAKETATLIEGSAERVTEGNYIVEKANTSLEAVVTSSREVSMLIEEVAADSTRQAEAIREMNQSIEQISSIVQENSMSAEESAAASEQMSAQAVMFSEIAAKFKLKP